MAESTPDLLTGSLRDRLQQFDTRGLSLSAWREQADDWSRYADERYRACAQLRPLPDSELPLAVGVKDTVNVVGLPTRLGLRHYRCYPNQSAAVLDRLHQTAIHAKLVTTELNIGLGSGCRNPYFWDYDPAGSSTGSAVAVAAGICDLALGTDVLGSVRWPAGRCGVVGLRTTHDASMLPGILPLSPSMDAVGWVTRTADDLAVLWDRLGLGTSRTPSGPPARAGRAGPACRIGIVSEATHGTAPEILAGLTRTVQALTAADHEIVTVSLGDAWSKRAAAWELCARDALDGYQTWRHWIDEELSASTQLALEAGRRVDDDRRREILALQESISATASGLLAGQDVDAWLLPLDPTLPEPITGPRAAASTMPDPTDPGYDLEVGYTALASFTGLPSICYPVGVAASGAPLAMQLVGPRCSESTLIRLAVDVAAQLDLATLRLQ